jgi:ferredoxin
MASPVFFLPLQQPVEGQDGLELPLDLKHGLPALIDDLTAKTPFKPQGPLGLKTSLGKPRRPAAIADHWLQLVGETLAPGISCDVFDTLSITTRGLEEPASLQEVAQQKNIGGFRVADDPALGPGITVPMAEESLLNEITCAHGAGQYASLAVLNPVRPHPHMGFGGVISALGLGLVDRKTKLVLHEDVRPKVDTPLCAGCGSCLDVCIFDAIKFDGGRAAIDHTLCTGCGECMDACFMAGIAPEHVSQVVAFQEKVADSAAAVMANRSGMVPCFNFLVRLDRSSGGGGSRKRLGDVGILASFDPVALDQAAWDMIIGQTGENLAAWSGFPREPEAMLARAVRVGLGSRSYDLLEVLPKK